MKKELEDKYFSNRYNELGVLSLILSKIKNEESLSLIRLGDGEGRMLGYPELVAKEGSGGESLDFSLNIWFGHGNFSEASLIDLSLQLRKAVSGADIVGRTCAVFYQICGASHTKQDEGQSVKGSVSGAGVVGRTDSGEEIVSKVQLQGGIDLIHKDSDLFRDLFENDITQEITKALNGALFGSLLPPGLFID